MSQFEFSAWATCGVGSSVSWEEESFTRKQLIDLPESLTAEQLEIIAQTLPPEQREMIPKREMSFRILRQCRATLVERHPDSLVVEVRSSVPGHEEGFTLQEVLHAVPPPPEPEVRVVSHWEDEDGSGSATVVKRSWDDLFGEGTTTEGEETIDVAGRPMTCRWTERSARTPEGLLHNKTWRCAELPGGIARFSFRMEGPRDQQTLDTRIVSFERKELRAPP